ncbi:TIGR02677 family protein [Salicibibacter halophilus]|uniref:TIGR02677 family protein n=1 Tax=Salicibibacter halophilus TaxID=2502791 RepID=A0A514LG63_9BACI|nr:TIGR02677 family protein [Salicibibacter halophilus]QDI90847.1 TIGR02677 family protein [Salicibibacter halophilus]
MEHNVKKRVHEATYLAAEKAWSYRAILRYCYIQHERMRQFLFAEEIHAYLQEDSGFAAYSLEELQQDLEQLVKWGNLSTQQETGKVNTVEEFKKKRFRYQCTPYTVEFERMMQRMEQQGDQFGGSLERSQFERLYQVLYRIDEVVHSEKKETDEECAQLWDDVMMYIRQITQNTSDYFAYIDSEDTNERMQTDAFLLYKDQFTTYLRDFIISLQRTALQIQDLLRRLGGSQMEDFFNRVIRHKGQVFRFEEDEEENPHLEYRAKWENLTAWFLGSAQYESEFDKLQERTTETIRRVTRTVQRLGERNQHFHSRRQDYLHLAEWFDGLTDINEAHKLSSVAFGVFHTKHLLADPSLTEDIYTDVWHAPATVHETIPRIRAYGEKTKARAVVENKEAKEAQLREHLQARQREQEILEQYVQGNEIKLSKHAYVETPVRKLFLTWISKAMVQTDRRVKTEFGQDVIVHLHEGKKTMLESDDGELELPDVTFEFVGSG